VSRAAPPPLAAALRRPVVVLALVLAVVAGALVGVQVRAHQAEERRAAALVAEEEAEQEAARAEAQRRAEAEADEAEREEEAAATRGEDTSAGSDDGTHPSGLGGPPSTGAGPDCGGPESYEPPKNDGSPVFYTSTPTASGDGSNGRMPRSAMAPLDWCTDGQGNQQWLRGDAARALTRLNADFRTEFGENIAIDLSYRSYADQVEMREWYGSVAAPPGTSNHGLGTAVDVWEWQAYGFGSARYEWLVENGPRFGWVAPGWARADGSNPEYWHFEYTG
jgi:type II secretory pathway pseudopilin PulG